MAHNVLAVTDVWAALWSNPKGCVPPKCGWGRRGNGV